MIALFLSLACQKDTPRAVLQLDYEWSKPNECSETSPEIRISGLPETAHFLRVRLIDLYQPGADHGGWEQIPVPAAGVIPTGGLKQYRGPCPPKYYAQNNYEFTVEALDPNGEVMAEGELAQKCCPDW
jgi:hypothetical protein